MVGSQLNGPLSGDSIRRIEADSSRNGSEHGKILQSHLTWAILT